MLRVLDLYYQVAIFELELRKCTSRTRLVLQSCDFRAGAAELYFACKTCATKLRFSIVSCGSMCTSRTRLVLHSDFSSWGCGSVPRVLDLHYTVAISSWRCRSVLCALDAIFDLELRKCTSRTRLARQSCNFRAGSAKVQEHCKTIRSPPKTITFNKVLGPSKGFRPLLIYIYIYIYIFIQVLWAGSIIAGPRL